MTWRMKDKHWQHWDAWRAVFFMFFLPNLCLWNQCASCLWWKFAFQLFDCPVGSQLQRAPPQYCTSSEREGIVASWTSFPCAKQPVSLPSDVFKPGKLREYSTSCLYAALGWNAYKRWLSGHVLVTVWAHGGAEVKQRGTYQQKSLKRMKWRIETCAVLKRPQNVFLQKIWSIIGIDLFSKDLVTFPESLDLKFVYPNPSEHKVRLADVQSFALHGLSIRRFVDSSFFSVWRCVASWKSGMSGSASWMPSFSWSAWVTPACQGSSSVNMWQTSYQSEIWKQEKSPTIYDATSISLAWEQRILLRLNRGCFTWPRHFGNSHGEHTQLSHDLHPRVLLLAPTECWLVAGSFTKCPRPCLKNFANTYHIETILSRMQRQTLYPS